MISYTFHDKNKDTGSIPINRLEDGQVFYIQDSDELFKVSESLVIMKLLLKTHIHFYHFLGGHQWVATSSIPAQIILSI